MARSNYAAKATESTSKAKADMWINLYYRNSAAGSKRVSLGGLPLTTAESKLHANLIAKLQACATPEDQAEFIKKIFAQVEVVITEPAGEDTNAEFDFDQF